MKKSFLPTLLSACMMTIASLVLMFLVVSINWSYLEDAYENLFHGIYQIENTIASLPH